MRMNTTVVHTFVLMTIVAIITNASFTGVGIDTVELGLTGTYNAVLWGSLSLPDSDAREGANQQVLIFLGCGLLGFCLGASSVSRSDYCLFLSMFSVFHYMEFALASLSHPPRFDALLLNHGIPYASAFTAASLEHIFAPLVVAHSIRMAGLVAVVVGLTIRCTAVVTAGRAFTHLISTKRTDGHKLVTNGIYRYMRHPGYCGWFLWVSGSQLLAGNLICALTFSIVTWKFFNERIEYEESLLVSMFGSEYESYRSRTPWSGVLFIK